MASPKTPARNEGESCTSLAELLPGARGRLCAHPPIGSIPQRLEEFGFVPGTALEVVRHAPLGDPVEIEIRGYRICLRRAELTGLCVVPADAA
jgi:ferrous iron transport protein A